MSKLTKTAVKLLKEECKTLAKRLLNFKDSLDPNNTQLLESAAFSALGTMHALILLLDPDTGIETETAEAKLTGPESSREEVTGVGTKAKNKNYSNTGFGGGKPKLSLGQLMMFWAAAS